VYHVAGVTAAKTKEGFYRGNHLATKNLLSVCAQYNSHIKRFIHVSSMAAVGPSLNGIPLNEQTPFHPITTYGKSKMAAEQEVHKHSDTFPTTIVRPPAVYGPRDVGVYTFFQSIKKGIRPLMGFKDKHVSLVHSTDLVNGIILAGESQRAAGQTYFISSERFYSWDEIGEVASRIMNKKTIRVKIPIPIVFLVAGISGFFGLFSKKPPILDFEKGRDIVQAGWICDVTKAKQDLGYKQTVSLEEGVRETIAWYREHGWL
jgi:nucleoside-diphosphate-sugar epimerase